MAGANLHGVSPTSFEDSVQLVEKQAHTHQPGPDPLHTAVRISPRHLIVPGSNKGAGLSRPVDSGAQIRRGIPAVTRRSAVGIDVCHLNNLDDFLAHSVAVPRTYDLSKYNYVWAQTLYI